MISELWFPIRIVFGEGAIGELPRELARLGVNKPLILTDKLLAKNGLLGRATGALDGARVQHAVFDEVDPDPTAATVDAGLACYRETACDGLVALGGGSAIDTAKSVRLLTAHPPPLARYDAVVGGGRFITNPMPPLVAIPTTAGTGSEVGWNLVVTLPETGRKTIISSPALISSTAICDPELTYGMPPWLTAGTGMDTLIHSLEALCARGFQPFADALARKGLELCGRYLVRAVKDGKDAEARAAMMIAAVAGSTAYQKGLGPVHSLAHALTPVSGVHHGIATAIVLPAVMEFNVAAAAAELAEVAVALGEPASDDRDRLARCAVSRVRAIARESGIPERLRDVGVKERQIPVLMEKAFQDGCHLANRRPCAPADLAAMLRASF
ncbi:MAG TPA: iron-containing alcohol dehydrogenase [Anaeromyxobacteraceae bacterium]|nr:iron-containing alcohol dehydrogenase [Anaeromyxobacteraceae bacterium]